MKKKNNKIVIAAGGTGGHLFPASSIKTELEKKGYKIYLITDLRGKRFSKAFKNISVITGGGMSGESFFYRLRSLFKLFLGFIQTLYYMIKINPKAVIGMGGYISVPVLLWAKIMGKKTFIHNADAILGNANILLSKFVDVTMVSFENTKKIPQSANPEFVGLPIREDVKKIAGNPYPKIKNGKITITVMGGSQGAQIFGTIVTEAINMFDDKTKSNIFLNQQVIEEDIVEIKKLHKKYNIQSNIKEFFDNPAELISSSHIFIGRAGASTVLEAGTIGVPSIFIPIMHKDRQQYINAEQMSGKGGAEIITQTQFSAKSLHKVLKKMIETPNLLENMAKKAKIFPRNNEASENIANLIDNMLQNK